jgi:hypothetical protein
MVQPHASIPAGKLLDRWEAWTIDLINSAAIGADASSLARLMDSIGIWDEFALQAYSDGLRTWGDVTLANEHVCRNADCRARLAGDLNSILSTLYDHDLSAAIRAKILGNLAAQDARVPKDKLARYDELANLGADKINLGHLENLIDGLAWLYPPSLIGNQER